jgi:hypothetical protein
MKTIRFLPHFWGMRAACTVCTVVALIFTGCATLENTRCEGVIFNGTGEALIEVYIAPAGTNFFTPLFTDIAQNNVQFFSVAVNFFCRYWDIHAVGVSGTAYKLLSVQFAAGETFSITPDDAVAEESFDEETW